MGRKPCLRAFSRWSGHFLPVVLLVLAGGGCGVLSLTGCAGDGENPYLKIDKNEGDAASKNGAGDEDWMNVFGDGSEGPAGSNGGGPGAGGEGAAGRWTIVVGTFSQAIHQQTAEEFRQGVVDATGLTGFAVTSRSDRSIVHYGNYAAITSDRMQADLKLVRGLELEGRQPFARAFASVVAGSEVGRFPQFSLVSVWEQYPRASVLYSLQIAYFPFDDEKSKAVARKAAEDSAARLRTDGDTAFYFHGPRMSVVTVGVFFEHDVDAITGMSRAIRQLQARYPLNLGNGQKVVETKRLPSGKIEKREQPSFLINVPKQ